MQVTYEGIPGSYSSIAAQAYFPNAEYIQQPTFGDAVKAVSNGKADYAMLPIENSTTGRIAEIRHLLTYTDVSLVGEYFLPIHHALIGLSNASLTAITHAFSHREALAQCRDSLEQHGITPVVFSDTAASVQHILTEQNPSFGALASTYAATFHDGVTILKERMEDDAGNVTRFVVVAKKPLTKPPENNALTSILFRVPDVPSALFHALAVFAEYKINMLKLESFVPMRHHTNAQFYVECDGSAHEGALYEALTALRTKTRDLRVLGSYEKSQYRETFA